MNVLLIIDLQNDFIPGGALAVEGGHEVIPVANQLIPSFDLVVATQDWHPRNHGSFAANHPGRKPGDMIKLAGLDQILWPVHCVQGEHGAAFAPGLETGHFQRIFRKGTDPQIDSYSGFFDNGHRRATGLGDYLRAQEVNRVFLLGLATDYCVRFTALDARSLGFEVTLIKDGCRAVDLNKGDGEQAVAEMITAGVILSTSDRVLSALGGSVERPS